MLTLKSFRKAFGDHLILDIPSLSFDNGIHWVKGQNGSGKSTLFNCLSGLSPYQGEVRLNDIDLAKLPDSYKLKVNYSQSEPIYPEFLTGNDLIGFYSKLKKAQPNQVEELSESLGVNNYAEQACGTYSSGMLKKLSLLLAFLGEPEWVILDEPLITLDKQAQNLVSMLIKEKSHEGVSFIFATHQDFENALIVPTRSYQVANQTVSTIT